MICRFCLFIKATKIKVTILLHTIVVVNAFMKNYFSLHFPDKKRKLLFEDTKCKGLYRCKVI